VKVTRVLVALLVVASAVACTKSGADSGEITRLRAAAGLDPCPATPAAPAGNLPKDTLDCLGDGPPVTVAALRGPLLINLWGSWCEPCQREVPALQRIYTAAHGRLHILGVDTEDSSASALDFAAHAGMTYPSVVDPNGTFLHALGRSVTPMTFFVDAGGRVVHTKYGQFHGIEEIRADVRQWLGVSA